MDRYSHVGTVSLTAEYAFGNAALARQPSHTELAIWITPAIRFGSRKIAGKVMKDPGCDEKALLTGQE